MPEGIKNGKAYSKNNRQRSTHGGFRMSERLRNAMEQGERSRHQPVRKVLQGENHFNGVIGWAWNGVEC